MHYKIYSEEERTRWRAHNNNQEVFRSMPIFEYVCTHCGHEFELFVRGGAAVKNLCPTCQSEKIDKRFSTFAASIGGSKGTASANPAPTCAGPV